MRQPVEDIPAWLAVPELAALPAVDQAAIAQRALESANARHPQGLNLPALLMNLLLWGATFWIIYVTPWLHGHWLCFALPVIVAVEYAGSMFFGWSWWRVAYCRHFKRAVRSGIESRSPSA